MAQGGRKLRLVFMGTPDFSVPALKALLDAGHEVACVYSQPPRPAGRGQKLTPTPVHAFAEAQGIEVRTPASLKGEAEQRAFAELRADAAVVVAYGLILPKEVLEAPTMGCFNIHASLLPRWRGAAPIQRAIEAGDARSGVCIMRMDEGLDTGGVVLSEAVPITPATNAGQLHDALSALGARLIVTALAGVADGTLTPRPQPADGVTYAKKIDKAETRLDWSLSAQAVAARVRAFYPQAWCELAGERLRVLEARAEAGSGQAGEALDDALLIACGQGALRLVRVQPAGKGGMDARAFLNGRKVAPGTRLD